MTKKKENLDFEIAFCERLISGKPDYVDALIVLAEAYTQKGLLDQGLAMDKRLAEILKTDPVVHYNLACSLALVGDKKEALSSLQRAIELGYTDWKHLERDPDLKTLKSDPEFDKIMSIKNSTI